MGKELAIYFLLAAITAFLITKVVLKWLIPKLKSYKMGQKILDIGPRWHKNKEGTPTMGGLAFLLAFIIAFTVFIAFASAKGQIERKELYMILACGGLMILNAAIGILDDYSKFFKKQNQGLKAGTKFLLQTFVAIGFTAAVAAIRDFSTMLYIPFYGGEINLGWGWYVFSVFLIVGFVNAVNLTDGVDGLAASVTLIVALFFGVAGFVLSGLGEVILSAVIVGGMLGFLVYNFHPAMVFMGDTGSLFLGGAVVSMAYMLDNPLLLFPVGIIYFLEALSDIIQVAVFKLTKKRVFKMAPIHHHFEQCGWSEKKIVGVFSLVTILFSVIAYFGL